MSHWMVINETGGPDALSWEARELGAPDAGEALIRHTAVGVNFTDVHRRRGDHHFPAPVPCSLGLDAAGVVEAVGDGVTEFDVGDRVAYAAMPLEAYSDERILTAERLVPLPDSIDDKIAAAAMVKGITVQFLIRQTFRVEPGQVVVFHAAAGGVGLIACQWLKHLGVTTIGTVGSEAKVDIARAHGADHILVHGRDDIAGLARELTNGRGVPVVYDSIGKATFDESMRCLAPQGMLVSFGNVSGYIEPVHLSQVFGAESFFFTWAKMHHYIESREDLLSATRDLFDVINSGAVKIDVNQTYPLQEAGRAHADLEARKTTGSSVLIP
ncbi:MAG: quinone oxidoreductase [Alphaproteobacteria bacterium]|nr:quinone oxidoreductase [Alphaproteobacteria bacterium]